MINYTPEQKKYKKLTPFKLAVLKNFPYIEADFDAMTNYEIMSMLGGYFNNLKDNEEKLEYNIEAQLKAYNALQEYVNDTFDTLNLQEYINNKLDKMAEDGTLDGIINVNIFKKFNDRIGYSLSDLGCVGDGTTDNKDKLTDIFNIYNNIYVDDDKVYYSSEPIAVKSNTRINGTGTLKATINLTGTIGDNINYDSLSTNKITTSEELTPNTLLKIYYENESDNTLNKRQMVKVVSSDGFLSNNLINYSNNYTIKKINAVENVKIENVTILDNPINLTYANNVYIKNVKLNNSYITVSYSYNFNLLDSIVHIMSTRYIDIQRGSSNCTISNCYIDGGSTVSDNGALKMNEVFYSNINTINFGSKLASPNGAYYAIFIDGDYAEDNYPNNPSDTISINNINVTNSYTNSIAVNVANNVNIANFTGETLKLTKTSNIRIVNSYLLTLLSYSDNQSTFIDNSYVNVIQQALQNFRVSNSVINNVILGQSSENLHFNNCKIENINNTYVASNSASNITFSNCLVTNVCNLYGIRNLKADLITSCSVNIREVYKSFINLLITGNSTNAVNNLAASNMHGTTLSYIINSDIQTDTAVSLVLDPDNNLYSNELTTTNNYNNNMTMAISKNYQPPTTGLHYKGEIVYNSSPVAGGKVGWICTEYGTPGTWKAFGTIDG